MRLPDIIPFWWKAGAALALVGALVAGHLYRVHSAFNSGHAAAVSERAAADALAVSGRIRDNAVLEVKQAATNVAITKAKNEEIAPVARRIAVDRVRVGPALCGPTAATSPKSAASSDGTDSPSRLVRADLERDIRALKLAVEEDLATGRACQAFLRDNGLVP